MTLRGLILRSLEYIVDKKIRIDNKQVRIENIFIFLLINVRIILRNPYNAFGEFGPCMIPSFM